MYRNKVNKFYIEDGFESEFESESLSTDANSWHKFSVSLVAVLFWLLPFLVNFYIANSLSHIEKPEYLNDKTCWREANSGLIKRFFLGVEFPSADTCSLSAHCDSHSTQAYMSGSGSLKKNLKMMVQR